MADGEKEVQRAEGIHGALELHPTKVVLRRQGLAARIAHGIRGDTEIQLQSIGSIQWRAAGRLVNGSIRFSFAGARPSSEDLRDLASDENALLFTRQQQPAVEAIKAEIERRIARAAGASGSVADELEKLAGLRDRGVLTEQELQARKRQLLGPD
jgi:hypothetical protein